VEGVGCGLNDLSLGIF